MAERPARPLARKLLTGAILAMVGVSLVWPAVGIAGAAGRGGLDVNVGLLGRSLGVAALIGVLATALALPAAWVVRGTRGPWIVLMMAPMLFPAYLSYTGWGVLRAPDTAIGRWLMMGPRGAGPGDSTNWYPTAAGYVLAVGGLALWSWPLAAAVMGARLRRVDDSVFDSLRIEVRSRWRRWAEVMQMCRGAVAAAVGVVMLVMLGSAVPLHLAQLDTYAIRVWRMLDQTAPGEHGRVWVSAWPLILIACGGAVIAARQLARVDSEEDVRRRARGTRGPRILALVVWVLAIVVPVVLLTAGVRDWNAWGAFWPIVRGPVMNTAGVAALVAVAITVLCLWGWAAFGGRGRGLGVGVLGVFLVSGLVPGVLVGAATARAWSGESWIGESSLVVVLAHIARFGMVGVMAGWWLSVTEGRWMRDLRELEVGSSLRGWVEAVLPPRAGLVAAAGVAGALLSFQEIESTVLVQPASATGGSLAWQMLQWLHFARMDDLGMGVLVIAAVGVAAGGVIAAGVAASTRG